MKRIKSCNRCKEEFDVMYRVQYKSNRQWKFLCEQCVLAVKSKNEYYRYGGTWKA
ncbi:hypothetical protein N9H57_06105 [Flavobacteriaceae bacterium]|nr:hypothetical protein [Flavobacteriaceae bacterium]MDA9015999.1 hypothetical protein [Flavobacteriaceae bacterium]